MSMRSLLTAGLVAAATLVTAREAAATNYTLWIHGRNPGTPTTKGNYADFSYWGSSATAAGVNKKAVNWDGVSQISTTNGGIRDALDCYCTGANWCYVAAHGSGSHPERKRMPTLES